jgi:SAM-dependent methyltransferase
MSSDTSDTPPLLSTPLPDDELILLIGGNRERESFARSRRGAVDAIIRMLAEIGVTPRDFRSILDFGCGCGRILAGWEGLLHPDAELHGCDINERLVRFCNENIKYARVARSNYLPPLPYADGQFDFIYAASVYTHLTLHAMLSWTGEIIRIIKPGGTAIITVHGSHYASELAKISIDGSQMLAEQGFYVHLHGSPEDTWLGSNQYATFVTSDFMSRIFVGFHLMRAFPGLSHGPTDLAAHQDVLIFRREMRDADWPNDVGARSNNNYQLTPRQCGQLFGDVAVRLEAGVREVRTIAEQLVSRWQMKDIEQAHRFLTRVHAAYAYGGLTEVPVTIEILVCAPRDGYQTNWVRPTLTPSPDVKQTAAGFESIGNDPFFWIDAGFDKQEVKKLHVRFNWSPELVELPRFYFDFGEGSSEALSRSCPATEGTNYFVFIFNRALKKLRFDPVARPGRLPDFDLQVGF